MKLSRKKEKCAPALSSVSFWPPLILQFSVSHLSYSLYPLFRSNIQSCIVKFRSWEKHLQETDFHCFRGWCDPSLIGLQGVSTKVNQRCWPHWVTNPVSPPLWCIILAEWRPCQHFCFSHLREKNISAFRSGILACFSREPKLLHLLHSAGSGVITFTMHTNLPPNSGQ